MEELTKTQIILLTLLVSFVTSIATGIVTVSLMDQAPPAVTQTVDKIIERTVQTIVPVKDQTIVKTPVPVSDNDLVVQAINQNSQSMVRIKQVAEDGTETYVGLGLVISGSGDIIADQSLIANSAKYEAIFPDGKILPLKILPNAGNDIALFQAVLGSSDKYAFNPAVFANSSALKLGETVVGFGGSGERNAVAVGVISELVMKSKIADSSGTSTKKYLSEIDTSLSSTDNASSFSLINLGGEITGFHVGGDSISGRNYLPANLVKIEMAVATSTISINPSGTASSTQAAAIGSVIN